MLDIYYTWEALFDIARVSLWFWLLFFVIGPVFMRHVGELPPIERLIYSCVGLGGTIIVTVMVLTLLHIYDFVGLVLFLILIPLGVNYYRHREQGFGAYLRQFELRTVISHVTFIEKFRGDYGKTIRERAAGLFTFKPDDSTYYRLSAISIAVAAGGLRLYPMLFNAAPFSRNWYEQLDRVKELRLQNYFSEIPEPGGMHSIVSFFSMVTRVSPEMLLHLMGALTSFFLCLLVYWATKDITKNRYPIAPILAMSVYALTPMLLLPLSLDQQTEVNTLDLALCFAIPTITMFVRNLRGRYACPLFYPVMGFAATALTSLFVAYIVLLPTLLIAIVAVYRENYLSSLVRQAGWLFAVSAMMLLPYLWFVYFNGVDPFSFIRSQIYDTRAYSYYPLLLADLPRLSQIYALAAAGLLGVKVVMMVHARKVFNLDELILLCYVLFLSIVYLPQIPGEFLLLDSDQMNGFYAVLICVLIGVLFANLLRLVYALLPLRDAVLQKIGFLLAGGTLAVLLVLQGGIRVSRVLPSTMPNGFFEAYYQIIDDQLPYSYATVGPEIDRAMAKNRHYFMNYQYFLEQYGSIDSLYHQWLTVPPQQRTSQPLPAPSIFVFMEKAPYNSFQQGILYDAGTVMADLDQWLQQYRQLEGRVLKQYYENEEVVVYQIVNREASSAVSDILWHIHPRKNSMLYAQ